MAKFPEGLQLESRPCPMGCEGSDILVLTGRDRIHGIPGEFQVVRCGHCGLMRTNPRPTPFTIGLYYPDDYGPYASTEVAVVAPSTSSVKRALRRMLKLEARRTPPMKPGHLLELGCASGSYLELMQRAGWTVEGIEFSETAAARARSKGFSVQTSTVEAAEIASASVDLVAAWMVLEHLHDPVASLEKIRQWIKPDGYLALSIPLHSGGFLRAFGNACYDLHLPNHLYHFSLKTIRLLLRRAGWEIENVFWQRNANTVLWTLEYAANDRGWRRATAGIRWLRTSKSVPRFRMFLGWFLGLIRASGRAEIWARAVPPQRL